MIDSSYIDPVSTNAADMSLGDPATDLNKWFLSVQDALALGNKSAATRLVFKLGAPAVENWMRQAGVEPVHAPDAKQNVTNADLMTLGDVASLYQVLGNDGVHRKLKIINSIQSRTGEILYDDTKVDKETPKDELLNALNNQQLTLTLQNALRSGPARTLARDYGLKSGVAGMPGYSDGYRDAWFVGYTPKLVAGVWVGYDDSRPIGSRDIAVRSAVPLWGAIMQQVEARIPSGGAFPVPPELTKVEIDRATGQLRGLAGLAPAPNDIFVYLKKEQVDAAGSMAGTAGQQIQAPAQWTDWLTTMFNQADETMAPDPLTQSDKRTNIIPSLAEYKMPALRGDILSSDGVVYATTGSEKNLVLGWPAADEATADDEIVRWMRTRLDEVQQTLGTTIAVTDADLLAQYKTQRYQPFMVMENVTPFQVNQVQSAGSRRRASAFSRRRCANIRAARSSRMRSVISRATSSAIVANT